MQTYADTTPVLERQLLLQLGDRIKRLRKAQGLTTIDMAQRVGISRTTLSSVEAGDPTPSIGTYLRVMSALGVAGDLAMLVSDTFQPLRRNRLVRTRDVAARRFRFWSARIQIGTKRRICRVSPFTKRRCACYVRIPNLCNALARRSRSGGAKGPSRSDSLWAEWESILAHGTGVKHWAGPGVPRSFDRPHRCRRYCRTISGKECSPVSRHSSRGLDRGCGRRVAR